MRATFDELADEGVADARRVPDLLYFGSEPASSRRAEAIAFGARCSPRSRLRALNTPPVDSSQPSALSVLLIAPLDGQTSLKRRRDRFPQQPTRSVREQWPAVEVPRRPAPWRARGAARDLPRSSSREQGPRSTARNPLATPAHARSSSSTPSPASGTARRAACPSAPTSTRSAARPCRRPRTTRAPCTSARGASAAGRGATARRRSSRAVSNSNLQPDFNPRVIDGPDSSAVLRELDDNNRFVQKSAESTSIWPSSRVLKFGGDPPNRWLISTQVAGKLKLFEVAEGGGPGPHVATCAEIDRWFGTSRPNFEILELGHIEVD